MFVEFLIQFKGHKTINFSHTLKLNFLRRKYIYDQYLRTIN